MTTAELNAAREKLEASSRGNRTEGDARLFHRNVEWETNKGYWEESVGLAPTLYDCDSATRLLFPAGPAPRRNAATMKAGREEDVYMYRHFFSEANALGKGSHTGSQHHFIELGALDGVDGSNSYFFEKHLGWGGVHIPTTICKQRLYCTLFYLVPLFYALLSSSVRTYPHHHL
jgi:hypothetical protein